MASVNVPEDPELAVRMIQDAAKQRFLENGMLGYVFGSSLNKPGNIAGLAVLLSFGLIFALIVAPGSVDLPRREIIISALSLISGALGFLFGRQSAGKR